MLMSVIVVVRVYDGPAPGALRPARGRPPRAFWHAPPRGGGGGGVGAPAVRVGDGERPRQGRGAERGEDHRAARDLHVVRDRHEAVAVGAGAGPDRSGGARRVGVLPVAQVRPRHFRAVVLVARDRELTRAAEYRGQLRGAGRRRGAPPVRHELRQPERGKKPDHRDHDDQLGERKPGLSVSHIRSPVTYHCTTPSPQNNAAAPPTARKGPNGIASLRPRTPRAIRATAHAPPSTTPTISANSAIFQPRKAPSIAPSFMSPAPIPPRLTTMIAKNTPPPRAIPSATSAQPRWRVATLAVTPARMPGRVIASGMI